MVESLSLEVIKNHGGEVHQWGNDGLGNPSWSRQSLRCFRTSVSLIPTLIKMATNIIMSPSHKSPSYACHECSNLHSETHSMSPTHAKEEIFFLLPCLSTATQILAQVCSLVSRAHMTPRLCWGCRQVMRALVEWIHLSTGNQKELNRIMHAVPGWRRSQIWAGAATPSAQMLTLQGSTLKRDETIFSSRLTFFFLQRFYFITENGWDKRKIKLKYSFFK